MRILLVKPVYPPTLWDFSLSLKIEGSRAAHAPLALPTLAALTPSEHEVRLVDENVGPVDLDSDVDLVGISGYWNQRQRVFELADAFRQRGRTVVIGGPMVDASTIDLCAEHADAVFQGEAEYTWPQFLSDQRAGKPRPRYVQGELVNVHDSPLPRFDLLARNAYASGTVETSRGCPYRCEFCEIPTRLGRKARTKTVEQVMAEVRAHYALGTKSVFIIDDHFVGNKKHAFAVLEALGEFSRSIGYAMQFTCQFSINLAKDKKLLRLLYAANVRRVFVGLETPRRAGLVEAKKTQNTVVDMLECVRRIQAHNISVWAGMIVGFDSDDPDVFAEHLAFLQQAGIPVVMLGLLQAIPGTPLYDRMQRAGRLREVELGGVRGDTESLLTSNIIPTCMSDEELLAGYQWLLGQLYDHDAFAERLLRLGRRGKMPLHRQRGALGRREIRTLGRLLRHYLLTRDTKRRRLFLRVVRGTLSQPQRDFKSAFTNLVAFKHLRGFYRQAAELSEPLPRPGVVGREGVPATAAGRNGVTHTKHHPGQARQPQQQDHQLPTTDGERSQRRLVTQELGEEPSAAV